jgi:hypothetical protein
MSTVFRKIRTKQKPNTNEILPLPREMGVKKIINKKIQYLIQKEFSMPCQD